LENNKYYEETRELEKLQSEISPEYRRKKKFEKGRPMPEFN